MITLSDEGYTEDAVHTRQPHDFSGLLATKSIREREELVYALLKSLPKSSLAGIQRSIQPMLQLDVVGLLPDEVALLVFSNFTWQTLLTCALVNRRWRTLSNEPTLWRTLCDNRDWQWRHQSRVQDNLPPSSDRSVDEDDEGMGDDEEDDVEKMLDEDSGFASMEVDDPSASSIGRSQQPSVPPSPAYKDIAVNTSRHSSSLDPSCPVDLSNPDYKLLFLTRIRLQNRMRSGSHRLYTLNTPGSTDRHTNTIYCLQLYTYPDTGKQVLFTGSKDRTVREWDLTTNTVCRIIGGVHEGSVLSICVYDGFLASGGSDHKVAIWDLEKSQLVKVIRDHTDSVLCVRFDNNRLVTCSKDRTLRSYSLPNFKLQYSINDHRAAVNAVSISPEYIVSASGDRSMKLWDAKSGALIRTFDSHHGRGIASIDFKPPYILSGSSDKHLRLIDMSTSQGWSTSPDYEPQMTSTTAPGAVCETCGNPKRNAEGRLKAHGDLVRSVALGADFAVSASYDSTIKIWDRQTGALVADLSGGHANRVFCVGVDSTKVVSCGEDQRICVWDFSHNIDTSFMHV